MSHYLSNDKYFPNEGAGAGAVKIEKSISVKDEPNDLPCSLVS